MRAGRGAAAAVRGAQARATQLDPYLPFVRETLEQYPKLRAPRLHEMLRTRGYAGCTLPARRSGEILAFLAYATRPATGTPVAAAAPAAVSIECSESIVTMRASNSPDAIHLARHSMISVCGVTG
jgi:hypothetical protein